AADMATLQYRFDCGTAIGFGPWMTAPSASCPTDDNATRAVKADVKDKDGGTSSYVGSVVVTNLPPVLGPVSVPLDPVPVGATVTASASFTDAGAADTHLGFVQWDLGGTFDAANPGVNEAAKSVTANSALAAGVYTISLRVRDDDGGEDTRPAASYVVVYDTSAAPVTPGGGPTRRAGATAPEPPLAGKATSGRVPTSLPRTDSP